MGAKSFALDACPTQNLYTIPDSPYQKIPVYDQDGAEICYAYVGSELANYSLLSRKLVSKPVIHPLWTAYLYSYYEDEPEIDGGSAALALKILGEKGVCNAEDVQKALKEFANGAQLTEPEVLSFLSSMRRGMKKLQKRNKFKFKKMNQDEMFNKSFLKVSTEFKSFNDDNLTCAKEDFSKQLSQIDLLHNHLVTIFHNIVYRKCTKFTRYDLDYDNYYGESDDQVKNQIRVFFTKEKKPLAIRFCGNVLYNDKFDGIENVDRIKASKKCYRHASLLVGTREKAGKCEYLLKNTWGSSWEKWTKERSCFCQNKKTSEYIEDCKKETHPESDYTVLACWIAEDKLAKNIYGTSWSQK